METTTTIEEQILERLRKLPEEKQREVLDFAAFLASAGNGKASDTHGASAGDERPASQRLRGLLADLDLDVSPEAIAAARREMWGNFPRDLPE